MSYELGLAICDFNENNTWSPHHILWHWSGWENTELFTALSVLSEEGFTKACEDKECHIPIENLDFIDTLYHRLRNNEFYIKYYKLLLLDAEDVAQQYLSSLSTQDIVDFCLCFYFENSTIIDITKIFFSRLHYDQVLMVESLYEGYLKAKELNLKTVVLYDG